jgi:hypothetical protein
VIWPQTFEQRLFSWTSLRSQCQYLSKADCLLAINRWWFNTPWIPYHLHWDDQDQWPDPWQLLQDNLFCSLARGLGIMYTITLIDRADLSDAVLIDVGDNLVQADQKKYILNWDRDQIVNINLASTNVLHQVEQYQIKQFIQ